MDSKNESCRMSNICRLCLSQEDLLDLFKCSDRTMLGMIDHYLGLTIAIGDGLPDTVCRSCWTTVEKFDKFREQCRLNYVLLRQKLLPCETLEKDMHSLPHTTGKILKQELPQSPPEKTLYNDSMDVKYTNHSLLQQVKQFSLQDTNHSYCQDDAGSQQYELESMPEEFGNDSQRIKKVSLRNELELDWEEVSEVDDVETKAEIATPWRSVFTDTQAADTNKISSKRKCRNYLSSSQEESEEAKVPLKFSKPICGEIALPAESMHHETSESEEVDVIGLDSEEKETFLACDASPKQPVQNNVPGTNSPSGVGVFSMELPKVSQIGNGSWRCNICGLTTTVFHHLKRHVNVHFSKQTCKCTECGKTYSDSSALKNHMAEHSQSSITLAYPCGQCHKSFKLEHLLQRHCSMEHSQYALNDPGSSRIKFRARCGKCPRVFKTSLEMEQHDVSCGEQSQSDDSDVSDHENSEEGNKLPDMSHNSDKSNLENFPEPGPDSSTTASSSLPKKKDKVLKRILPCYMCDLVFTKSKQLIHHTKTAHNTEWAFKCMEENCGKLYQAHLAFNYHRGSHKKKFTCKICKRVFPWKSNLIRHQHVHKDEKPFTCDICGSRFKIKIGLRQHMMYHLGELPFECEVCGKRCIRAADLRNHMRTHTGVKPHTCDICGKGFTARGRVLLHRKVHENQCTKCEFSTGSIRAFKRHQEIHEMIYDSSDFDDSDS